MTKCWQPNQSVEIRKARKRVPDKRLKRITVGVSQSCFLLIDDYCAGTFNRLAKSHSIMRAEIVQNFDNRSHYYAIAGIARISGSCKNLAISHPTIRAEAGQNFVFVSLQRRGTAGLEGHPESGPGELHPRPLTERCVNLSIHSAPIKRPDVPMFMATGACCNHHLLLLPVGQQPQRLDPTPLLQPHYTAFFARTGWSVPVLRIGTLASWIQPLVLLP